jgi:hypothetical protein
MKSIETSQHFPKFVLYFDNETYGFPYVIYEATTIVTDEGDENYAERKYQGFQTLEEAMVKMGQISKYKVPIAYAMEASKYFWRNQ